MKKQQLSRPASHETHGFRIQLSNANGLSFIGLAGSVDIQASEAFESAMLRLLGQTAGSAVLDLQALNFINVIGLGVIVRFGHELSRRGDRLILHGAQPHICQLIQTMNLHELFPPLAPKQTQPVSSLRVGPQLATCA